MLVWSPKNIILLKSLHTLPIFRGDQFHLSHSAVVLQGGVISETKTCQVRRQKAAVCR